MKQLASLFIALTFVSGFPACKGSGNGVAELKKLKEKACACEDKACADAVDKEIESVSETISEPSSEQEEKELIDLVGDAAICLAKVKNGL